MKIWLAVLAAVAGASAAFSQEATTLNVGDPVPALTAVDDTGKKVDLSSFKDKSGVVIFFFPKAFTGG